MKRTNTAISFALMTLLLSASVIAKDEQPVATVNGVGISVESLNAYMNVVNRGRPGAVSKADALDDLIVTEVALQQARKEGYADRADIQEKIHEATKKIILSTWTREKSESIKVSDEELKAAYDKNMGDQEKQEFKARHILLKTEDEAKAVIKEISDGADFAKVAEEKSTGPSASKGGDLGWFKSSTMVPPFSKAVAAMKKGDVSEAPVKTNFGWHVIKLEDVREAQLPAIDSMKPQLKRTLVQEKMMAMLEEIKDKAEVVVTLPEEKPQQDEKK